MNHLLFEAFFSHRHSPLDHDHNISPPSQANQHQQQSLTGICAPPSSSSPVVPSTNQNHHHHVRCHQNHTPALSLVKPPIGDAFLVNNPSLSGGNACDCDLLQQAGESTPVHIHHCSINSVSSILGNCRSKDATQAFSCLICILADSSMAEYLAGGLKEKDSDLGTEQDRWCERELIQSGSGRKLASCRQKLLQSLVCRQGC